MSCWRGKKRELESERDSGQQRSQEEKNPIASGWNHWLRHPSQNRHQSLETTVWPQTKSFEKPLTSLNNLFRNEGVVIYHFLYKIILLHMHFK